MERHNILNGFFREYPFFFVYGGTQDLIKLKDRDVLYKSGMTGTIQHLDLAQ